MPATITPTSIPVIAGAANNAGSAADSSAPSGEGNSFAALFQQLAGKQLAVDAKAYETVTGAGTEMDDALAALLPFLDAMGLAQALPTEDKDKLEGKAASAEQPTDAIVLAGIATGQPTQAAAEAAISAETDSDAMSAATGLATPGKGIQPGLGTDEATTGSARSEKAGNEFAAQLVASIENSREQPHLAGSTAAAALQGVTERHAQHAAQALPVAAAVGTEHWNEEVGNRVVWMASRLENRAELVLTPPQMGRVEVTLSITGDQASATFASANPVVREALEAALPRLREVLADAGIQLGQAQVGAENARQSAQQGKNGDNSGFDRGSGADMALNQSAGGVPSARAELKMGRGLVDVFA